MKEVKFPQSAIVSETKKHLSGLADKSKKCEAIVLETMLAGILPSFFSREIKTKVNCSFKKYPKISL